MRTTSCINDDYAASLPPFLLREVFLPHCQQGGKAVILAEEWQTAHTVVQGELRTNLALESAIRRRWKWLYGIRDPPREAMQGLATCVVRSDERWQ
jgi:hypothetical protein